MLGAELGVRLQLWMGPTIPVPVAPEVIRALSQATVQAGGQQDGFQLTFRLTRDTVLDYSLLDAVAPMTRVSLGVLFGAMPEALMEGVITNVALTPSDTPGASTVTVSGRDVSVMMDLREKNQPYSNRPDNVVALELLAPYAKYGVVPFAAPVTDVPIETERTPQQTGTDLAHLRAMAQRNGYVFHVDPVGFGASLAYWGPEVRGGFPQPALTIGMGPHGNTRGLSFSTDALAPVGVEATVLLPFLNIPISVPALPPLKLPPLAARPLPAHRTRLRRDTAKNNPATAATRVVAEATNAPDPVSGQGQLDAVRYGGVLRPRKLVGVRGAGFTHDGLYYVESVSHTITPGGFTSGFTLKREGTGSLLPILPT
jgi:hypothetical protein